METQIHSFYQSPKGAKLVTIFGYATKGVPGLEINGAGKLSKNIREKLIYLTRTRRLSLATKRFVICVDINDLDTSQDWGQLKWLEFPILLLFWYLAGLIPISKFDDCLCAGWISSSGEIYQKEQPKELTRLLREKLNPVEMKSLKYITMAETEESSPLWTIDSHLLLEHIPNLKFKIDYIDKVSDKPINSFIT